MRPCLRLAVVVLLTALPACRAGTRLQDLMGARQQSADLIVRFTKAADASNRAVMADTDERSTVFAREAAAATEAVAQSLGTLATMLDRAHFAPERERLRAFEVQFGHYRELDRRILELAVDNTNLKAQRLSFGQGIQAADALRDALSDLTPRRPADAWRLRAQTALALSSLREVAMLQGPHIAEADDVVMTALETRMTAGIGAARAALSGVEDDVVPGQRERISTGHAALERFIELHAEIVELSRRNSDVRSLALTLNQKRTLTAECEASAITVREALTARSLGGSR